MIYESAQTAQDIARLLRTQRDGPIQISAPRQSGKTTELLKYAEEKNPNGMFAVVCLNHEEQKRIIRRHFDIFNRTSQAEMVAARLLGKPTGGIDINPPLMITPSTLHLLRGHGRPIYVDELGAIPSDDIMEILLKTRLFVASVTS